MTKKTTAKNHKQKERCGTIDQFISNSENSLVTFFQAHVVKELPLQKASLRDVQSYLQLYLPVRYHFNRYGLHR